MSRYRAVVRILFAVVFLAGGLVHLYFGRFSPRSYAVYADTALWPWLAELWTGFVMTNIGWLSVLMAGFEIALGAGLLRGGRAARWATLAALGFFAFILVLGYAFPTAGGWEDFLVNRAFTLVMVGALASVLLAPGRGRRSRPRNRTPM